MTLYKEYTPPTADSTFNESHDKEKYLRLSLLYGFPSKKAFGWRLSLYGPPFLALKLASISFCKQKQLTIFSKAQTWDNYHKIGVPQPLISMTHIFSLNQSSLFHFSIQNY